MLCWSQRLLPAFCQIRHHVCALPCPAHLALRGRPFPPSPGPRSFSSSQAVATSCQARSGALMEAQKRVEAALQEAKRQVSEAHEAADRRVAAAEQAVERRLEAGREEGVQKLKAAQAALEAAQGERQALLAEKRAAEAAAAAAERARAEAEVAAAAAQVELRTVREASQAEIGRWAGLTGCKLFRLSFERMHFRGGPRRRAPAAQCWPPALQFVSQHGSNTNLPHLSCLPTLLGNRHLLCAGCCRCSKRTR